MAEAEAAPGPYANNWTPGYFLSHSVPIAPGATQAFDMQVVPVNAACTFWFEVTIFNGVTKDYKYIEDGSEVFRVSSMLPVVNAQGGSDGRAGMGYGDVYLGGDASSDPNGALVRTSPARKPKER